MTVECGKTDASSMLLVHPGRSGGTPQTRAVCGARCLCHVRPGPCRMHVHAWGSALIQPHGADTSCLPACLPACLHARMHACTCMHACMLACGCTSSLLYNDTWLSRAGGHGPRLSHMGACMGGHCSHGRALSAFVGSWLGRVLRVGPPGGTEPDCGSGRRREARPTGPN